MDILKKYSAIIFLLISALSSAEDIKASDLKNIIGLKASNLSGYGLYYTRKLSDNYWLQAMGLIYYYRYEKDNESDTIFNYDIGLEFQRNIYKTENSRTYFLLGGYYYYDDDTEKIIDEVNSVNNSYNIGTGFGFEIQYKRIVYNIDVGYKFFEDNIDTFRNGDFSYNELKRVTKAGAGIGIGFMF